ncbi:hypothetical protein [Streptomyces sp. NPDC051211]|uniref:hypothetical protein n=1 Tax=Streptomyces sp. NPDC051211 TaxID=3154643 RepID=UPI00344BEC2A
MERRGRILSWTAAVLVLPAGFGVYKLSGIGFDESDLRGRWGSEAGGEVSFGPNGEFTAMNIGLAPECDTAGNGLSPERRVSGAGQWKLGGGADSAEIAFRPSGEGFQPCTIRAVHGKKGLRFVHDSDSHETYRHEPRRSVPR